MDNYPREGRLIIVANHTGVMETVLMTCFAPRQIEFMGSVDLPHEPQMALFMNAYKFIPVYRGNVSISAMKAGVNVLNQEGVIGIYPEGGIWEPAIRQAQSGVAWMSFHGKAPVLPIGFAPTAGALGQALAFKKPRLVMNVGELIPPVKLKPGVPKKEQFRQASQKIMDAVWDLIPENDRSNHEDLEYERFELIISGYDKHNKKITIPPQYSTPNGDLFSKLLYRTTLINNFQTNLKININALKNLNSNPSPSAIYQTTTEILGYLKDDNPYYFTYRYGQEEGARFQTSIEEVNRLAAWAAENDISLSIQPIRRVKLINASKEVVEIQPTELPKW
jgi:1-acyl-sn-glycerol-3-phosphate acyltransferase